MQWNAVGLVHEALRRSVSPGTCCIDATAGKGRDTALLCHLVGTQGRVLAFDIQPEAIAQTRALLEREGLAARAQLIQDSHAHMARYAAPASVQAIVFNFGRLPGGDPRIITQPASSLAAVEAGLQLLQPGGLLALALYYGGFNGTAERDALLAYLAGLDSRRFTVLHCDWLNRTGDPPFPVFVRKEPTATESV